MTAVISVSGVYKDFRLPQEKQTTLKRSFIHLFSGRRERVVRTQHALRDISFSIEEGEFFGIVGRNGSGKSTLLKILAGIYAPNQGSVQVHGRLVPFIELGVGFNGELSGRDNVYLNGALLGFARDEVDAMYDDIVSFAELGEFMDQKLKNYSSGMQVRLAFSVATRAKADILLVDEVLAVGDASFQRKCFSYFRELKKQRKTVVFISHDMNAIREYCDRAMLIESSEIKLMGHPDDVAREYAMLFMGNTGGRASQDASTRWGTGTVRVADIEVSLEGDDVVTTVLADAHQDVEALGFGIHFMAEDGSEVTAVNNQMIRQPDLKDVRRGDRVRIVWRVLNVFNDGTFNVVITLKDELQNTVDWVQGPVFVVRRIERSTTAVLPPVTVESAIVTRATDLIASS